VHRGARCICARWVGAMILKESHPEQLSQDYRRTINDSSTILVADILAQASTCRDVEELCSATAKPPVSFASTH
jgi:hypothetical protein